MSVTASSFHLSDATKPSQTGMTAVLRHTTANRHTTIHSRYLIR
ncbi:MAG: hypothetical protein ACEY3L_03685 [Wolbachia sp.]